MHVCVLFGNGVDVMEGKQYKVWLKQKSIYSCRAFVEYPQNSFAIKNAKP
jgi:hypothetical protein